MLGFYLDMYIVTDCPFTFTFIYLADAFIQSDLQLLYMSEVARLWSN